MQPAEAPNCLLPTETARTGRLSARPVTGRRSFFKAPLSSSGTYPRWKARHQIKDWFPKRVVLPATTKRRPEFCRVPLNSVLFLILPSSLSRIASERYPLSPPYNYASTYIISSPIMPTRTSRTGHRRRSTNENLAPSPSSPPRTPPIHGSLRRVLGDQNGPLEER